MGDYWITIERHNIDEHICLLCPVKFGNQKAKIPAGVPGGLKGRKITYP